MHKPLSTYCNANHTVYVTVLLSPSVQWQLLQDHTKNGIFKIHTTLSEHVGVLWLYPGITSAIVSYEHIEHLEWHIVVLIILAM